MKTRHVTEPLWIGETQVDDLGWICAAVSEIGLRSLAMGVDPLEFRRSQAGCLGPEEVHPAGLLVSVLRQIQEYLAGRRQSFEIPIDWEPMSPFQRKVLRATAAIPFGQVRTYGEVAGEIGQPHASRAVGAALAANPIPLVIPCHRVVGGDRKLHGFSAPGGLDTKAWLLRLEGHTLIDNRTLARPQAQPELF